MDSPKQSLKPQYPLQNEGLWPTPNPLDATWYIYSFEESTRSAPQNSESLSKTWSKLGHAQQAPNNYMWPIPSHLDKVPLIFVVMSL